MSRPSWSGSWRAAGGSAGPGCPAPETWPDAVPLMPLTGFWDVPFRAAPGVAGLAGHDWRAGRCGGRAGGDQGGDGCLGGVGGGVVEPGQVPGAGEDLDLAEHLGGGGLVGEPGADQRGVGAVLGQPDAPGGHPPGPGCLALREQCPAQLVQPPGGEVDPDAAGGGLGGDLVIGGQPQLDADPFGRVQPAQRGQPPVGPARPQLEFPQRELEQDGRDHRHEAERLRGGRAPRGVREVEGRGGGDQAPHGQAGRQAGFGSRGPAGQQDRAHPGRAVQGQEQQVRPWPGQAHVVAGEPGQALGADPGGHAREPAEQHVLGGRRSRLPAARAAGHRLPAEAVRAPRRQRARPGCPARPAVPCPQVSRDGLSAERCRAGAAVPGRLALRGCLCRTVITYFITRSGNLDHQSESILDRAFRRLIVNWCTGHQAEAL